MTVGQSPAHESHPEQPETATRKAPPARRKHWNYTLVTDRPSPDAPSLTQAIIVQMVYWSVISWDGFCRQTCGWVLNAHLLLWKEHNATVTMEVLKTFEILQNGAKTASSCTKSTKHVHQECHHWSGVTPKLKVSILQGSTVTAWGNVQDFWLHEKTSPRRACSQLITGIRWLERCPGRLHAWDPQLRQSSGSYQSVRTVADGDASAACDMGYQSFLGFFELLWLIPPVPEEEIPTCAVSNSASLHKRPWCSSLQTCRITSFRLGLGGRAKVVQASS